MLENILVSKSLTGWDHLGIFTLQVLSCTPVSVGRTAGSAVVTGLLVSPSGATAVVAVAAAVAGGGWHTWTVCP